MKEAVVPQQRNSNCTLNPFPGVSEHASDRTPHRSVQPNGASQRMRGCAQASRLASKTVPTGESDRGRHRARKMSRDATPETLAAKVADVVARWDRRGLSGSNRSHDTHKHLVD